LPGRNFRLSGLGVVSVWMNIARRKAAMSEDDDPAARGWRPRKISVRPSMKAER
jgi:hypothetical protein